MFRKIPGTARNDFRLPKATRQQQLGTWSQINKYAHKRISNIVQLLFTICLLINRRLATRDSRLLYSCFTSQWSSLYRISLPSPKYLCDLRNCNIMESKQNLRGRRLKNAQEINRELVGEIQKYINIPINLIITIININIIITLFEVLFKVCLRTFVTLTSMHSLRKHKLWILS